MYLIDRHQLLRKFHKYIALSDATQKGKDNLTSAKRKNNKPGAACELPDGISLPRCAAPSHTRKPFRYLCRQLY